MLKHSFSILIAQFCTTFMSNQSGESLEQSGESHPTGLGLVSAEGVEAAMTEGAGGPWEGGMDQASVLVLQKECCISSASCTQLCSQGKEVVMCCYRVIRKRCL